MFNKKKECEEYSVKNGLAFYQKDLNSEGTSKIYVADSHENVYARILQGDNNYYESWGTNQHLKLYIDYDKKDITPDSVHITDIINIINTVTELLPPCKPYILKSYPDDKKRSYHIIFEGIHFSNYRNIKSFMEEKMEPQFKDLFARKIIDLKVYTPICLRSLLCTKHSQNRPLYLLDTEEFLSRFHEKVVKDITLEVFKSTCVTSIEKTSVLFTHKTEKKRTATSKKVHLMDDKDIYSDKEIVKKYLDILDPERYTDRGKWLNVGYILHSIGPEFRELWHYFSEKWDGYNSAHCDTAWNSFGSNSEYIHTIHNLVHLAQKDNPGECKELVKEIPDHDIKYLRPFDNVISKVIFRMYGEVFVCSNPEKNEWYHYNGISRWLKENKSYTLRKFMINDVFSKVEAYRRLLVKECADDEVIKNYHNILKILGSGIKLNCLELEFYNCDFYKIIDQHKHLLGFDNGVLDLKAMEFRAGVSTDYISMSTGYNYQVYEPTHPMYIELVKIIHEILPDKLVREFTMKALASCLDGYTADENFYIFSGKNGTGGNGKSTLVDLVSKALGDYAYTAPVTLLTTKREGANNANSALVGIRNKRFVPTNEPEAGDLLQASTVKSLTGGDMVSTRELHASQIEFKPHAKFIMCCNKVPSFSDFDGGVLRRVKITEFTSRFVEKLSESSEDGILEFEINKDLKDRLEDYSPVFMNILIDYYKLYKNEGIHAPPRVLEVTRKYHEDNDTLKFFVDEFLVRDKTGFITREELKDLHKSDSTLRASFKKFGDFVKQIENMLNAEFKMDKKLKKYKMTGWSVRTAYEDDEDSYDDSQVTSKGS